MQMKLTLIGWYNYDANIFADMVLPTDLDRITTIETILMRCGEFNIIYSNLEFLRYAIKNWSERHLEQFTKIYNVLSAEYNPIHNYDRHEEYVDKRTNSGTAKSDGNVENTISADNSTVYQPDNKSINNISSSTTGNENLTHDAHLYGNIGVVTSQEMLIAEVDLRKHFGIYDIVAASFMEEFTMPIYG